MFLPLCTNKTRWVTQQRCWFQQHVELVCCMTTAPGNPFTLRYPSSNSGKCKLLNRVVANTGTPTITHATVHNYFSNCWHWKAMTCQKTKSVVGCQPGVNLPGQTAVMHSLVTGRWPFGQEEGPGRGEIHKLCSHPQCMHAESTQNVIGLSQQSQQLAFIASPLQLRLDPQ